MAERAGQGKRVGVAFGAWPLIHGGSVRFLEEARAACDFLYAVILGDASAADKTIDGKTAAGLLKPDERRRILAAMRMVDGVETVDSLGSVIEGCRKAAPRAVWFVNGSEGDVSEQTIAEIKRGGVQVQIIHEQDPCVTRALLRRMAGR
jgi:bifunctional ADP-heptose synthase (sugar kinase/adenylyltransferase)